MNKPMNQIMRDHIESPLNPYRPHQFSSFKYLRDRKAWCEEQITHALEGVPAAEELAREIEGGKYDNDTADYLRGEVGTPEGIAEYVGEMERQIENLREELTLRAHRALERI